MRIATDTRQTVLDLLPEKSIGAEIGVFMGDLSDLILRYTNPALLHLVDPWANRWEPEYLQTLYAAHRYNMEEAYQAVLKRFAEHRQRIHIHRMASTDFAGVLPNDALDFVYIDGDHHYEAVAADLKAFWPKVRERGLICIDDYELGCWWGDGVVRAVNEFIGNHPVMLRLAMDNQIVLQKLT